MEKFEQGQRPNAQRLWKVASLVGPAMSEQDQWDRCGVYQVPINRNGGEGICAIPYIHGFSWYEVLAHHQPVHLENDANCVRTEWTTSSSEIENTACVVVGTGISGAMIINGKLHRGRHGLGGEVWLHDHHRAGRKRSSTTGRNSCSTEIWFRYVIEKSTGQSAGMDERFTKRLQQEAPSAKKPLSAWILI